jgi:DNA-binding transcriptional ArsR family regulator
MKTIELLDPLKALADENRLKLLNLLLTQDLCVGALARRLGITEAAVSQHLQVLRKAGLVFGVKRGYWTHYAVERGILKEPADRLNAIADESPLTEGCCRMSTLDQVLCRGKEVPGDVHVWWRGQPQRLKGKPEE